MRKLIEGLIEFERDVYPRNQKLFRELANRQQPEALLITCSDSRLVPALLTQSQPGDYFVCRNAGNLVPRFRADERDGTSAAVEYAVSVLGVRSAIVLGHSDCGAMKGVLHPEAVAGLPCVSRWLQHAGYSRRIVSKFDAEFSEMEKLRALTEENIIAQLENLKTHPSVAAALSRGELDLHGLYYDIPRGRISAYDGESGLFVSISRPKVTEFKRRNAAETFTAARA